MQAKTLLTVGWCGAVFLSVLCPPLLFAETITISDTESPTQARKATVGNVDPIAAEIALSEGILLYQAAEYQAAKSAFERAEGQSEVATAYKENCQVELRNHRQKVLALYAARNDAPSSPKLAEGMQCLSAGDLGAAEHIFVSYLEEYPEDAYAHLALGAIQQEQGDTEAATEHFHQAACDGNLQSYANDCEASCARARRRQIGDSRGFFRNGDRLAIAGRRWNFTVLTGYQYDSNVTLSPDFVGLGSPTNKADGNWFVASFGEYRLVQQAERNVGLIFSSFDSFYFNQQRFNFQDYMGGAYTNAALGESWLAGARFEYHESLLDYHDFANQYRLVPNLTYREGSFGHTTTYYEYNSTWFNAAPLIPAMNRNGDLHAVGVTQAIYRQEGQGRIFLGYRYEGANAQGTDFDRKTNMVTARIERPIGERWVGDAEVRQFWDNYQHANSLDFQDRARRDERTELRMGVQRYFSGHSSLRLDYTFIQSNSNVANLFGVNFYEYRRHLVSPQFIYDF